MYQMLNMSLSTAATVLQLDENMSLNDFARQYTLRGHSSHLLHALLALPALKELDSEGLLQHFLNVDEGERIELRVIAGLESSSEEEAMLKEEGDKLHKKLKDCWLGCTSQIVDNKRALSILNLEKVASTVSSYQKRLLEAYREYLGNIGASKNELETFDYFEFMMMTNFKELESYQKEVIKSKKDAVRVRIAKEKKEVQHQKIIEERQFDFGDEEQKKVRAGVFKKKNSFRSYSIPK